MAGRGGERYAGGGNVGIRAAYFADEIITSRLHAPVMINSQLRECTSRNDRTERSIIRDATERALKLA